MQNKMLQGCWNKIQLVAIYRANAYESNMSTLCVRMYKFCSILGMSSSCEEMDLNPVSSPLIRTQ